MRPAREIRQCWLANTPSHPGCLGRSFTKTYQIDSFESIRQLNTLTQFLCWAPTHFCRRTFREQAVELVLLSMGVFQLWQGAKKRQALAYASWIFLKQRLNTVFLKACATKQLSILREYKNDFATASNVHAPLRKRCCGELSPESGGNKFASLRLLWGRQLQLRGNISKSAHYLVFIDIMMTCCQLDYYY